MRKYIKSFQGLRVIAAVMVFLSHTGFGAGFGSFAVVVFFMLSGFLAQMKFTEPARETSLGKECAQSLWKGYKKYLPLHALMILAVSVFTYRDFITNPLSTSLRFLANLLLIQCWSPNRATNVSFNYLSWYLSALMFCLLLSPIIVRFFSDRKPKRAAVTFLVLIAVQFGLAIAVNGISDINIYTGKVLQVEGYRNSAAYWLTYIFPPARVLNYATGCALFTVGERLKGRLNALWNSCLLLVSAVLGAVVLFLCNGRDGLRIFDVAVWLIPSCGIILSLSLEENLFRGIRFLLSNRVMIFFGGVSYEFYMVHEFIFRCARSGFRLIRVDSHALCVISAFLASVCAAVLLHLIESFLKKRRLKRMQEIAD